MCIWLLRTQSAKNTIFAFPKTFTIFYLRIYYFKVKVRLILILIVVILGNAEIADWVLSNCSIVSLNFCVAKMRNDFQSKNRKLRVLSLNVLFPNILGGKDSE